MKHLFRECIDSLSEGRTRDRKRQYKRADTGERRFTVFAWIVGRVDGRVRNEGAEPKKECRCPLVR
jgi:hypothetical protein